VGLGIFPLVQDTIRRDQPVVEKRKNKGDDEGKDCVGAASQPIGYGNRRDPGRRGDIHFFALRLGR